jgi:hypothetical protein
MNELGTDKSIVSAWLRGKLGDLSILIKLSDILSYLYCFFSKKDA